MKSKKATAAIKAHDVRVHIHNNPGQTSVEIYAAIPDCGSSLHTLQRHRLIRFTGGGKKGPARWFSIPQ